MRILAPLLLTLVMTSGCNAGEADIKKNIETRFPGAKVDSVTESPAAGVYEVVIDGGEIIYSNVNGDYVMTGDLLETASRRNLTKERMEKLSEVKFESLPLDQAIKTVKGDGKRVMAVFSDPDCPYCVKLEHELVKLDNVTIYTFMFPLPMHADAPRKSRLVWCSDDRAQAWKELTLNKKVPAGKGDCPNPIEANLALAEKMRVNSTPTIILGNGKRLAGALPAAQISKALDAASQ
jgi:thiol:disulfide interchange protein DsbC